MRYGTQIPHLRHSRAGGNPSPARCGVITPPSFPRRRESIPGKVRRHYPSVIPAQAGIHPRQGAASLPLRHSRAGGNPSPARCAVITLGAGSPSSPPPTRTPTTSATVQTPRTVSCCRGGAETRLPRPSDAETRHNRRSREGGNPSPSPSTGEGRGEGESHLIQLIPFRFEYAVNCQPVAAGFKPACPLMAEREPQAQLTPSLPPGR